MWGSQISGELEVYELLVDEEDKSFVAPYSGFSTQYCIRRQPGSGSLAVSASKSTVSYPDRPNV